MGRETGAAAISGPDETSRRVGRGFLALAGVVYGLLVFGASVRVHGAGLSCPDWPLCFGQIVPQLDFRIFLEWGHRNLAGMISIGFLGLGGFVLARPALRARVGGLVILAALALAAQVVLGGLTVLKLLAFWSVTLHLLTGNTFFVLLLLTGLQLLRPAGAAAVGPRMRLVGLALALAVPVQMALGGLVSSNYAGLACPEWPTCSGGLWFPVLDGIVGLQIIHRLGAYTVLTLAAVFAWTSREIPTLRARSAVVFGVAVTQVALGVANIFLAMPVELAILHSAVADLLVAATTFAVWTAFTAPRSELA